MVRSVETGNIRLLKSLVESASCSLNSLDDEGNNLLHLAVLSGRQNVTKYISRKCEDLMTQWNIYGLTPIHLALLSNHPGLVDALLWITRTKYQDIRTTGDHLNLFQYTVKNSHSSIVKFFLSEYGGNPRSITQKINESYALGRSSMHLAASLGYRETVNILFDHGGNLFIKDFEGMLPFHHAISNGFLYTAKFIANLMKIEPHTLINDDLNGSSCLLKACENGFDPIAIKGILKWKGDISKMDRNGHDSLYFASRNPKISRELIEILLKYKNNLLKYL